MGGTEGERAEAWLTPADAEGALPLSVEAGWNQTLDDWRFMLSDGEGIGLRDGTGRWIATAIALPLAPDLAWLCMVLVAKDQRRRGIGTRLLGKCIDHVRARGAAAGLDATELGRPVYIPLGFRDLYTISRWRLPEAALRPDGEIGTVRAARLSDMEAIAAFDEARSSMRRRVVLHHLFRSAPQQALMVESGGRLLGYALGRPGRTAVQVGPVVADDEEVALALVARARPGTAMLIDVPDRHRRLARWLENQGAVRERGFTRMVLGPVPPGLDDPSRLFALAGPELG